MRTVFTDPNAISSATPVTPTAVTRTVRCCLWGAQDTLTLQYTDAVRQVIFAGGPDPLDEWFCDACYEYWREVGVEIDGADGDREVHRT